MKFRYLAAVPLLRSIQNIIDLYLSGTSASFFAGSAQWWSAIALADVQCKVSKGRKVAYLSFYIVSRGV